MTHETPSLEHQADQNIAFYLALPQKKRENLWTQRQFLIQVPYLVSRLISSEGINKFSLEERTAFYDSCIKTFIDHPRREKPVQSGQESTNPDIMLPSYTWVDLATGQVKSPGATNAENLLRAMYASIFALGLSIDPGDHSEVNKFLQAYNRMSSKAKEGFYFHIGLLLPKDSVARAWILQQKAPGITEETFDTELARLLMTTAIPPKQHTISSLPTEITNEDKDMYSLWAFDVFLDFVLQAMEENRFAKANSTVNQNLLVFANLIGRRLPPEYSKLPHVRAGVILLLHGINPRSLPEEIKRSLPQADKIRRVYRSTRRRILNYGDDPSRLE